VRDRVRFPAAHDLLVAALADGAFPAAAVDVGRASGSVWSAAFGHLNVRGPAHLATPATIFDLASLTKVMATTCLFQREFSRGRLTPETPLQTCLPEWDDGGTIVLRQLLDHSSGLAAHARLWTSGARGPAAYLRAIATLPRERPPGEASVYSDLGFILLGFALERWHGAALQDQFDDLAATLALGEVAFLPPTAWRERTAPTEVDPWRGRLLIGEVHDENAWAIGGAAGHAGLFGTVAAVGAFARAILQSFHEVTAFSTPDLSRLVATRTAVSGSSRALGWDTMLPSSSCGRLMSSSAIGHTGFTGTSLWIDWERDFYVVLLTNRVCPTRDNVKWQALRPAVHDAIVAELG
jgi:CubicO group peptidase (beta-lactamase class C family)